MNNRKPTLEKIRPGFGSSVFVRQDCEKKHRKLATWHVHPEIELVYVNKGKGTRHIGNHLDAQHFLCFVMPQLFL